MTKRALVSFMNPVSTQVCRYQQLHLTCFHCGSVKLDAISITRFLRSVAFVHLLVFTNFRKFL